MKTAVAVLTLLLAGCASTQTARRDAEAAEKARLAAEARRHRKRIVHRPADAPAPRAANLKLGISASEAKVAMGEPVRARRMTSLDGTYDILEYDGKNLRFKNDRLVEIQYVR